MSQIEDAQEFSFAFRNFLDRFYADVQPERMAARPAGNDRVRNAYLAATADFLSNKFHLRKPVWLKPVDEDESLVADPPYFASTYWKTRVWLLADSPQEFRQRNLFVGADALSRV